MKYLKFTTYSRPFLCICLGVVIIVSGFFLFKNLVFNPVSAKKLAEVFKYAPDEIKKDYTLDKTSLKMAPRDQNSVGVVLGETKAKEFEPALELNRWDNEVKFKLKPDVSKIPASQKKVTIDGNKINYETPDIIYQFYNKPDASPDGGYEFSEIIKTKPNTNVFTTPIETQNLDFFYQAPLDQKMANKIFNNCTATECKDKKGNITRSMPENAVGSYAAYYKGGKKGDYTQLGGKNYATGKAFHIYRPKIFDANGNWVWGEFNKDLNATRKLSITVPQDFLDKAVYPVTIDPTFGYSTQGVENGTLAVNYGTNTKFEYRLGNYYTPPSSGTLDSVTAYLEGDDSFDARVFVNQKDSEGDNIHGQIATATRTGIPESSGWKTFDLNDEAISASEDYIVSIIGNGEMDSDIYFDRIAWDGSNETSYIDQYRNGDPWGISTLYGEEDSVTNGGHAFIAISEHTSTADDEPGVGVDWETYWTDQGVERGYDHPESPWNEAINPGNEVILLMRLPQWEVGAEYPAYGGGESFEGVIKNDGFFYLSLQAHTSTADDEPGVGVDWETYWVSMGDLTVNQYSIYATYAAPPVEFVSVVDPGNGAGTDYVSLSDWNAGVATDLTADTTQVFSGTLTGTIADNTNIIGGTSGATATVVHANTAGNQILLENISGAFMDGEKIIPIAPTAALKDDFNRNNEGPPMTSWTDIQSGMEVSSNATIGSTALADNSSYYNVATYGPDVEAFTTISAQSAPGFFLLARIINVSGTDYNAYAVECSNNYVSIYKVISGSSRELLSQQSQAISNGDSIGIKVVGNTISSFYKPSGGSWSQIQTIRDSSYAGTGYIGLAEYYSDAGAVLDNFGGGTISNYFTTADTGNSAAAVATCRTTNGAADTTAVTISGWTTDSDNYIKIWTDPEEPYRHQGKLDTSKYNLNPSSGLALMLAQDYVKVDGLQIIGATNTSLVGIQDLETNSYRHIWISNSIFKANGTLTWSGIIFINDNYGHWAGNGSDVWIWNNIIFDSGTNGYAIYHRVPSATVYAYNNTIQNCDYSFAVDASCPIIAINNLIKNAPQGAAGTFSAGTDYNATDRASVGYTVTGSGNTHDRVSQTFSFLDATNKDFHLAFADTGAKGYGENLINDPYLAFQNDIDGQERTGNWSIGADEPREAEMQSNTQKMQSITDGLVMYQSFDGQDISGTNSADRSGNNNNGTISGATTEIGKRGQALSFDGTDDWVSVPSSVSIDDLANFSFSVWVFPHSWGPGELGRIFDKRADAFETIQFYWDTGGSVALNVTTNSTLGASASNASAVSLNAWHHLVGTYSDTGDRKIRIYLDGSEVAYALQQAATGTRNSDAGQNLVIGGRDYGTSRAFDGVIDEVRIYNRALSEDEIGELYTLGQVKMNMSLTNKNTSGLVGMWSFDGADINGTNAYDRSRNNNTGTITGATQTIGKKGQGLSFNGTNNYITMGNVLGFEYNNPFSVSLWIKRGRTNAIERFLGKMSATGFYNRGWTLEFRDHANNNLLGFILQNVSNPVTAVNVRGSKQFDASAIGVWYHIALTYDGSGTAAGVKMYVDGASDALSTISDTLNSQTIVDASVPFQIGARNGTDSPFQGMMDEVRIYDRALSPDEVGDLYRLGTVKIKR